MFTNTNLIGNREEAFVPIQIDSTLVHCTYYSKWMQHVNIPYPVLGCALNAN